MDWKAAVMTFLVVLLSEIGDKTQLATMAVAAQSRSPGMVFIGAAAALVLSAWLGVLVGEAVTRLVSPTLIRQFAGVLFLLLGCVLVLRQ